MFNNKKIKELEDRVETLEQVLFILAGKSVFNVEKPTKRGRGRPKGSTKKK